MIASGRGEDEYKRTLYDKHGPEAAQVLQTASSVIIPVVAGGLLGAALAADFAAAGAVSPGQQGAVSIDRADSAAQFVRQGGD